MKLKFVLASALLALGLGAQAQQPVVGG